LKPYTYVDQTLKGIQSWEDQKSLQSIIEDHMEEKYDEDSEDQSKINNIETDQIVVSKET
jgi:hypothetical protein